MSNHSARWFILPIWDYDEVKDRVIFRHFEMLLSDSTFECINNNRFGHCSISSDMPRPDRLCSINRRAIYVNRKSEWILEWMNTVTFDVVVEGESSAETLTSHALFSTTNSDNFDSMEKFPATSKQIGKYVIEWSSAVDVCVWRL